MPDPSVDLNKYFSSKIALFRNNREHGAQWPDNGEETVMDCSLRAQRATRAESTACWPLGVISDAAFPRSWCCGVCKATGAHTSAWLLSASWTQGAPAACFQDWDSASCHHQRRGWRLGSPRACSAPCLLHSHPHPGWHPTWLKLQLPDSSSSWLWAH